MATYATGKELRVAFFSGSKMPVLTPKALSNSTDVCGTFRTVVDETAQIGTKRS